MTDEDAAQSSPPVESSQEAEVAPPAPLEPAAPLAPEPSTAQRPGDEPLPPPSSPTRDQRALSAKGHAATETRKQKKLSRIMEAVSANGKITNDEVEKLLHVSDATATRYLAALEKERKVKKIGTTGAHVVYIKV